MKTKNSSADSRKRVSRFLLQPTASFPDGAPQREEWIDDESFLTACEEYEVEWRSEYICEDSGCENSDCPQHYPDSTQRFREWLKTQQD
jgi:hypothetical protein